MPDNPSFIARLKRKKILFLVVLLFLFILLPQKTYAGMGATDLTIAVILLAGPFLLELIAYGLAKLSAIVFNLVISRLVLHILANPITKDPIFVAGWITARDFGNMLIVLAVVGIAVATILRFRDYEAKKLLLPIIIIALLINFSNVFVGAMIDASDIVMKTFINSPDSAGTMVDQADKVGKTVVRDAFINMRATDTSGWSASSFGNLFDAVFQVAIVLVEFGIVFLVLALAFFFLEVLLVARYALLGIFFVLSPLAFVFRVFPLPDAKKLWTSWWEHFIKWCFVGMGMGFSLRLALSMLDAMGKLPDPGSSANTIFRLFVVVMILFIGMKITLKSSVLGAAAVIGLATAALTGGAALALGAATKATSGTGKVSGVAGVAQRARERASDFITRTQERIGLAAPGTTRLQQQARLEKTKSTERIKEMAPHERQQLAVGAAFGETAKNDKVAAIKQMVKEKEINNIPDVDKRKELLDYVAHHDGKTDIYSQVGPSMAKYDTDRVNDLIRTNKMKGINMSQADAQKAVEARAYAKLEVPDIKKLPSDEMNIDFIEHTSTKKLSKAAEGFSSGQVGKLKALLLKIGKKGSDAADAGDTAKADEWEAKYLAIEALS